MRARNKKFTGFTLIELAIVLVVIGLIVGGVLVGRDMIFQSEVRSIITEIEQFNTAAVTFRTKYDCLPGDCNNATNYFGTKSTGCPTGAATSTGTCNGDGNNQVDGFITGTSAYGGNPSTLESFLFWQQLSLAKLVTGNYTGLPGVSNFRQSVIGSNVPPGRMRNVGYTLYYYTTAGGGGRFYAPPGNAYEVGAQPGPFGIGYETDGYIMSAREAFAFDTKFDDGKPALGKIITIFNSDIGNCVDAQGSTAQYRITNSTGLQCSFVVRAGF